MLVSDGLNAEKEEERKLKSLMEWTLTLTTAVTSLTTTEWKSLEDLDRQLTEIEVSWRCNIRTKYTHEAPHRHHYLRNQPLQLRFLRDDIHKKSQFYLFDRFNVVLRISVVGRRTAGLKILFCGGGGVGGGQIIRFESPRTRGPKVILYDSIKPAGLVLREVTKFV